MKKLLDFLFGKDRKAAAESIFWNLLEIIGIASIFAIVYGFHYAIDMLVKSL